MKTMILKTIAVITILALSGCGFLFPDNDEDYSGNFMADTPVSGAGGTVTLQENRVSGDLVYLDVYIEGVTDMLGASLKLSYNSSILDWSGSYEAGALLEGGGTPNYLVNDGASGELTVVLLCKATDDIFFRGLGEGPGQTSIQAPGFQDGSHMLHDLETKVHSFLILVEFAPGVAFAHLVQPYIADTVEGLIQVVVGGVSPVG